MAQSSQLRQWRELLSIHGIANEALPFDDSGVNPQGLMRLPAKVRQKIYGYTLEIQLEFNLPGISSILEAFRSIILTPVIWRYRDADGACMNLCINKGYCNLLRTCKSIYLDAVGAALHTQMWRVYFDDVQPKDAQQTSLSIPIALRIMRMPTSLLITLTRALRTRNQITRTIGKAWEVVEARHRAGLGTELSMRTNRIRGPARQQALVLYLRSMFAGLNCEVTLIDMEGESNLDEENVLHACEEELPIDDPMQGFDRLECPTYDGVFEDTKVLLKI